MPKDKDGDNFTGTTAGTTTTQLKRPAYNRFNSDSQVSDHAAHQYHRIRPSKHVVGGGTAGRFHARVPSSKALAKNNAASTSKLNRRPPSPSPERAPMISNSHRRAASDVKLPREPSSPILKKNSSHSSLQRNLSHAEIGKRSKSATSLKRASSHKDVHKLKGAKGQVHFDLGNEHQEDEWVDASASASPYLSRRGSVVSSGQSSAKAHEDENNSRPHSPEPDPGHESEPERPSSQRESSPELDTTQHNKYITSRLLQRTPAHSAPPQMSTEIASVAPHSGSPESPTNHGPSSLFGTPKNTTLVGSGGQEDVTSRFVNGHGSGTNGESGSFFTQAQLSSRRSESIRRPQSLGNLTQGRHPSISDHEDDSALAPRTSRSTYRAAPADKSRTQQKLNLQRASSSIEPAQAGGLGLGAGIGGLGLGGASPLVGGSGYDYNRDPRVSRLVERTGMEYLVVRRYQNPIARSIARVAQLPGAAEKNRRIVVPKHQQQNGGVSNGTAAIGRNHLSRSFGGDGAAAAVGRSRPATPSRRSASLARTNGGRHSSSFEEEQRLRDRISGASYVNGDGDRDGDADADGEGEDGGVAALLRNLWDKNLDLSASSD
ncbi:hypothetical protein F5B20DRAFT_515593 [Whalleya microplaca]|nr:hypothetical protein F5B20DRAFT_515593 [Whalleya microplaca]